MGVQRIFTLLTMSKQENIILSFILAKLNGQIFKVD